MGGREDRLRSGSKFVLIRRHQHALVLPGPDSRREVGVREGIGAAQHEIVAGADHQVQGDVGLGPGVRDGGAVKVPLTAQQVFVHGPVVAVDHVADAVEGRHQAQGTGLHNHLEGLEIDLAQRLLGDEGDHAAIVGAVELLIIADEVLVIGHDALGGDTAADSGAEHAGQHSVLGIILEVAAVEGVAVGIQAAAMPAGNAQEDRFVSVHNALLGEQFLIPGRRTDGVGHITGCSFLAELHGAVRAGDAHGTLDIGLLLLPGQGVHVLLPHPGAFVHLAGDDLTVHNLRFVVQDAGQVAQGNGGGLFLIPGFRHRLHIPGLAGLVVVRPIDFLGIENAGLPVFQGAVLASCGCRLRQRAVRAGGQVLDHFVAPVV